MINIIKVNWGEYEKNGPKEELKHISNVHGRLGEHCSHVLITTDIKYTRWENSTTDCLVLNSYHENMLSKGSEISGLFDLGGVTG